MPSGRTSTKPVFDLKSLSREAIPAALSAAQRHRLLGQSWEAESICRDILATDPTNREARITLLLALTDQVGDEESLVEEAEALLPTIQDEYDRALCTGVIYERRAKEMLAHGTLGAGPAVYDLLRKAMSWFERAESLHPPGVDEALLRWNTCARMIMRNDLRPAPGPPRGT